MLTLTQRLIKQLQADLPLGPHPFKQIARQVGTTEDQVLALITQYLKQGVIRRFGAILGHQRLGFVANGMGVWRVPEEETEQVGKIMAAYPEVSHCYQRPTSASWPYNLYTMIHAASRQECAQVAARISQETGIQDYQLLFSTRELKKTSMTYY